MKTGCSETKL